MSLFNKVTKTFQWGPHRVVLETGEIARQSSGAVLVNIEDTVVLATVVAAKSAKPGQDFFPLTVDYIEKTYAAGKIPGSFFKREGRPSELETLTSRLIDRPIRPLFPDGFFNEVQVVVHVLSLNPEVQADIAALIGSSAALAISGIPFNGPIGAARVGYVNGQYVLNPGKTELADSKLDLVVAGTEAAVLMVESEADQLPEEVMLGAVVYGHEQGKVAIEAIHELVRDAGKPAWDWQAPPKDEAFIAKVTALGEEKLRAAYQIRSKQARTQACREAYAFVIGALTEEGLTFDTVKVEGPELAAGQPESVCLQRHVGHGLAQVVVGELGVLQLRVLHVHVGDVHDQQARVPCPSGRAGAESSADQRVPAATAQGGDEHPRLGVAR